MTVKGFLDALFGLFFPAEFKLFQHVFSLYLMGQINCVLQKTSVGTTIGQGIIRVVLVVLVVVATFF